MPTKNGKICAVVAEHTVETARAAIRRAPEFGADLIELRLDYLRDFDFSDSAALARLLDKRTVPVIITCRAIEEGGYQRVDDRTRMRLLIEGVRQGADYCDIEATYYKLAADLEPDPSRTIISYHDFEPKPHDIDKIYEDLCKLPAAVYKIVTMASDVPDVLPTFRLIDRAKAEGRNVIALSMGKSGTMTRVIGPMRGAWLSYATLDGARGSAPGQLSCQQLAHVFRLNELSERTAVAGVIGQPVGHSVSPEMHNAAMAAEGVDAVYLPIDVSDVRQFFRLFVDPKTRKVDWPMLGFSVTIPHKMVAMEVVDELEAAAQAVGALNTIVIREGRLIGYNTDVEAAIQPLERACALSDEKVAVLGAGGSARAVLYGLQHRGIETTVFARNPDRAQAVASRFGTPVKPLEDLASSNATIVINATPVGMRGHSEGSSPVDINALRGRRIAYDLVYNPIDTGFLKLAKEAGVQTIGGLDMLVGQAGLQFQLWTGKPAPIDIMRAAALAKLTRE